MRPLGESEVASRAVSGRIQHTHALQLKWVATLRSLPPLHPDISASTWFAEPDFLRCEQQCRNYDYAFLRLCFCAYPVPIRAKRPIAVRA